MGAGEYLHSLYDKLHDSPIQQKFRQIAPMPFGVVFLPWKGMTEEQMREHFRLMKSLGFHNLKQTMSTPEWPAARIKEIALDEDIIPFWYGEGGWEPITGALLDKLGIPRETPIAAIRSHPKMRAYQKEIIRRGIAGSGESDRYEPSPIPGAAEGFRHTPDPFLRAGDIPHFKEWLRANYKSPEEINDAWNLYEVGISPSPFAGWSGVNEEVLRLAEEGPAARTRGREYGRIRDILRYKAEYRARQVKETLTKYRGGNPYAPTRTGGEMGLFLPFAWRATNMELLAETQREIGSFYPSIHLAWHYGEVSYEVARTIYMQASFAHDLFKGGWSATWESTGGPQQLSGGKGWDYPEQSTTAGFTVNEGTISQLFLSYLAAGFKGAGIWTWNYRRAGWEGGEYALLNRQWKPSPRAIRAGKIAQAAERYRDEIWRAHKEPYVGILVNWDSDAIWAAASVRGRDHFRHYPVQARVGVSRALTNGNIPWEHVTVSDLRAGLGPRYKVIYLPAQLALGEELLQLLTAYVQQGGRLVLDAPGGWYDENGLVLNTASGSLFEKLFGVEIADFQYSNNVPRRLANHRLDGFILDLNPTRAKTLQRFQTEEPAVAEHSLGKGSAIVLAYDASHAAFKPGNHAAEQSIRRHAMGSLKPPYMCEGAIVYRLAAPEADHYFLINDGEAKKVTLKTPAWRYTSATDPVTGETLEINAPIPLEPHSARWLRLH